MTDNEKGGKRPAMLYPTIILGVIALILLMIGYFQGEGKHIEGTIEGMKMLIIIFPLLFFAFIMAGMIQVILPHEIIARWVGAESGFRGLMLGTLAGAITPGGPYVSMPIAAGLLRAGASTGTMVAFLTGWSIWAISRMPIEVGLMGWKFTLIRMASSFFFPPIAGFIAQTIFGDVKLDIY